MAVENKDINAEKHIEFQLGGENYAIPLSQVREVISIPAITPIPQSPLHFLGIMNIRGQTISVIDLRKKLKTKKIDSGELEESIIIVEIQNAPYGLVVDKINRVIVCRDEDCNTVPEIEHQVNNQYIIGVYKKDKDLTVLIDIPKVLNLSEVEIKYTELKAS